MVEIMKPNRLLVLNKYGGHCAYCGVELDLCNMQIDHIKSKASGQATEDISNYNPSCPICNNWKHSDNIETFRRSIEQQVRKCRDYSRNYRMAERYGLVKAIENPIIVFFFESYKQ
jgi:5-methylcytosine-specific restriction endonuclease McrA